MEANIVFLNVGWMRKYRGLAGDSITGGGAYVQERGYGHEIFNFEPFQGNVYGYVQVNGGVDLARIGANYKGNTAEGVLAVWVATHPAGGSYIVGWYSHATVFRYSQEAPLGSARNYKGDRFGYRVSAAAENAVLLDLDERVFEIPRGKGGLGQANIWYADKPQNSGLRQRVIDYIETRHVPSEPRGRQSMPGARQMDPFRRKEIEERAVELVVAHYQAMGYGVNSVEKDNVGWDLEARLARRTLYLEVKGLSQTAVSVEMTPNEYKQMLEKKTRYRLCVVTEALASRPNLSIFAFSPDASRWEDAQGRPLHITEVKSARANAT